MKEKNKINLYVQAAVVLLLLCSAGVGAVHQATPTKTTTSTVVQTNFIQGDIPAITVTVIPSMLQYNQRILTGRTFTTLELLGEGVTTVLGSAQLPTISRFIEIPQGAQPELTIESVSWETISLAALDLPSQIQPVQPSLLKMEGATVDFTMDASYYHQDAFLPSTIAQVMVLGEIRAYTTALLQVSPVQYNPVTGELRVMTRCDLQINLPGSDMELTAEKIDRYATPSFTNQYDMLFANAGSLQGTGTLPPKQEGYLIIVYDQFYNEILPLASWKESKGFDCTVTKTTEIPGGPTKENIKAFIVDAYNNWPVPPAYVLLVGDVAQIPAWTGQVTSTCTDLYYATIDAGNYFADIIISRFPGATPEHITNMVDKTIYYEVGSFPENAWIKKAAFMASTDNYDISEGTHNYVINTYMIPHNYTCDKLYSYTYSATTAQVAAALNNGRSLAIYSGHGGTDYWADGPVFHQSDVNGLTNDGMYPFVCSHACVTGTFSSPECFGETWLRASHKAGLAFWGASDNTYWDEDDILERSMFKAWWNDSVETIGGMTNMGLYYLYQYYSGGGSTKYYYEAYNVLGDSSVKICTGETHTNTPPAAPDQPTGPTTGEINLEYTFTTKTTDAQNDQVYYMVSWGDTVSGWLGPYSSGETVSLTHTWAMVGDYSIKVKAKDTGDLESDWSAASAITILSIPRIEIGEITGGFGLTAEIKNVGAGEASDVTWSITLDGGLVLLGRETTGTFTKILPGFSPKATTGFVLGFGKVTIVVKAGDVEKTATATLFGPFFLKVQ